MPGFHGMVGPAWGGEGSPGSASQGDVRIVRQGRRRPGTSGLGTRWCVQARSAGVRHCVAWSGRFGVVGVACIGMRRPVTDRGLGKVVPGTDVMSRRGWLGLDHVVRTPRVAWFLGAGSARGMAGVVEAVRCMARWLGFRRGAPGMAGRVRCGMGRGNVGLAAVRSRMAVCCGVRCCLARSGMGCRGQGKAGVDRLGRYAQTWPGMARCVRGAAGSARCGLAWRAWEGKPGPVRCGLGCRGMARDERRVRYGVWPGRRGDARRGTSGNVGARYCEAGGVWLWGALGSGGGTAAVGPGGAWPVMHGQARFGDGGMVGRDG